MEKAYLAWSSGKDSAWSLWALQQRSDIEVVRLFTTINEKYRRVFMHAIPETLLQKQAEAIGIPLSIVSVPDTPSNEEYDKAISGIVDQALKEGVKYFAFGDLFLEDVRRYREDRMKDTGIQLLFPLWGKPTNVLANEMINGGLKAIISCVDAEQLSETFAGRDYDTKFLRDLPAGVDPCGEKGEFHSFVFDGPMFAYELACHVKQVVHRERFTFADLRE